MADWTPPSQTEVEGCFERLNNHAAAYCRQHRLAVSAGGHFLSLNAAL